MWKEQYVALRNKLKRSYVIQKSYFTYKSSNLRVVNKIEKEWKKSENAFWILVKTQNWRSGLMLQWIRVSQLLKYCLHVNKFWCLRTVNIWSYQPVESTASIRTWTAVSTILVISWVKPHQRYLCYVVVVSTDGVVKRSPTTVRRTTNVREIAGEVWLFPNDQGTCSAVPPCSSIISIYQAEHNLPFPFALSGLVVRECVVLEKQFNCLQLTIRTRPVESCYPFRIPHVHVCSILQ